MRSTPRPRRTLHPLAFALVRPLFRLSYERDAWVLLAIGDTYGPVIRKREPKAVSTTSAQAPPSA